jgi:maleylpyruvate isomerase
MSTMRFHEYWRSGAAWRVRIALALKGLSVIGVNHDLRIGAQREPAYTALNPQGLVPALEIDGDILTQSLAILEWLEEVHPNPPLLPSSPIGRAHVRAMCNVIACDTHPLQNLRVQQWLRGEGVDVERWNARWIGDGLKAFEALVQRHGNGFCYGAMPTMADCLLLPQLYSARRFGVDTRCYPSLAAVESTALRYASVGDTHPDNHPDRDS